MTIDDDIAAILMSDAGREQLQRQRNACRARMEAVTTMITLLVTPDQLLDLASGHVPMSIVAMARFALDFPDGYLATNAGKPDRTARAPGRRKKGTPA